MPLPLYLLGAVLAFALSCPAASAAASSAAPRSQLEVSLLDEHDPFIAEDFLKDKGLQERLKAQDVRLFNRLFSAATEARDMLSVLATYDDPGTLRLALAARGKMDLAARPEALLAWMKKHAARMNPERVEKAVWEWKHLTAEQQAWLAGRKLTAQAWARMDFPARQKLMAAWGKELYAQAMAAAPKTPEDLGKLRDLEKRAWGALDEDQRTALSERMEKAETAVKSLADAERRLAEAKDPRLGQLLAQAKASPSLEGVLTNLGSIFDGLGVKDPALNASRPAGPGQTFSPQDRGLVADMLKSGLLKEVAGTTGGDLLVDFYKDDKRPLRLTIEDIGTDLAQYRSEDQTIVFGQAHVERFLRTYGGGMTVEQLKKDPKAMAALVWELAPSFVHEGTHHRQDIWGRRRGLPPDWYDQGMEIETKSMEALFVLEKSARSTGYRTFLADRQQTSDLAKEYASLADSLQKDPVEFRSSIRQHNYPSLHSTESQAWEIHGERSRADRRGVEAAKVPGYYRMFRQRYDEVDALVEKKLSELPSEPAPAGAPEVPLPGR